MKTTTYSHKNQHNITSIKNDGFSLLEMLLMLILIALLSWSFITYRTHQQEKIAAIHIQNNLNSLWTASKLFYHNHCEADAPFSMDFDDIKDHLKQFESIPAIRKYAVSANYLSQNPNKQPLYQLIITLTFSPQAAKRLDWFQQQLGGEIIDSSTLRIEKLPSQITLANQPGLADAQQQFFCNYKNLQPQCAE